MPLPNNESDDVGKENLDNAEIDEGKIKVIIGRPAEAIKVQFAKTVAGKKNSNECCIVS